MFNGFERIQNNFIQFSQGEKNTSVGFRIQFQQFAFHLFRQKPLLGHGIGSFQYLFNSEKPIPEWSKPLFEPHNQYSLTLVELGFIGMLNYLLLLGTITITCLRLKEMRTIALGILLSFILGSFSDSLLFYSATGYFFVFFVAICLGENLQKQINSINFAQT